jgi:serine/threonine protein kinase/WD40 repeat protein
MVESMGMPAFQQIEELFHAALALPPRQRPAFLDNACGGDGELRSAVEDLLANARTDILTENFLVSPVAAAAADLRAAAPTVAAGSDDIGIPGGVGRPPKPIPGYEILTELGRGGMGVVYKVRQTNLGRIVALKMLLAGDMAGPEMLARFRAEAEALAKLQHPHIIAIHDIGEHDGRPYFTMEYIAGPSLDRLLQGRPQDVAGSARLVETLARTMYVVHQQGIIHRDLKPANVLLQMADFEPRIGNKTQPTPGQSAILHLQSAIVKITDFGLAKDQASGTNLTRTGATLGTPSYMAPEQAQTGHAPTAQAQGKNGVGPGTDIYALGSILYEMLTGRPPFEGESPVDILTQLLHEEPLSPARLRPKLPRDLVTICLKCLEKSPRKRYASAWDLAEDLRRFQAGEPISARAVGPVGRSWRWCRRRPLVAGLCIFSGLLIVTLVATVLLYEVSLEGALAKAEGKNEEQRHQIVQLNINIGLYEVDNGDTFKALLRYTEALRLDEDSPDERSHRRRIATLLLQCPRLLQLRVEDSRVLCTHLHADGGWMATVGPGNAVEVRDVLTGRRDGPVLPLDDAPIAGAIGPGARAVAIITRKAARVWDLTSGQSRQLPSSTTWEALAAFHPEGRVLVTRESGSIIRLWDLAANQIDPPAPLSGGAVEYALSGNVRRLVTLEPGRVAHLWDVATGQTIGQALHLADDMSHAALSVDGRRIAFWGLDSLRIWDAEEAGWLSNPIDVGGSVDNVEFSPDAERVVASGTRGVQVWQARTGERSFSQTGAPATRARFGPRGRLLVATTDSGVRIWDSVTGRAAAPPLRHGGLLAAAAFVAEGKQLITIGRKGTVAVWELRAPGDVKDGAEPDLRPVADLVRLAQVLACGRIDESQTWQALEMDRLAAAWAGIRSRESRDAK